MSGTGAIVLKKCGSIAIVLIERRLINQIYVVASVASVKMRRVRWAIMMSLPAILAWFALLAWSYP